MLDQGIKAQLTAYLERLQRPIELVGSLADDANSAQMRELLSDIAGCSAKVAVRFDGTDARKPSFSVGVPGETPRIRFAGLPMGHEFTSLVLALLQTGGHPPKEDPKTLEAVKALTGSFDFVTYVSLTCQNCPDVVQALNLMAVLNPNVTHTMVDGSMFQAEVEAKKVMAVPTVELDAATFGQGRMSLDEIVAKLDTGAAERAAAEIADKGVFDVLVVGGGPAGAAAAIYAARKGIKTGVVAERFGGQVLDTMEIANFVSVPHTEGPTLAAALEAHVGDYDVDVMKLQRATGLVPAAAAGEPITVELASGAALKAKSVILSTGARWREMGVPGEADYKAKGVCFCPHCDGPLFKGKRVAVIGGGNSGVEAAIDLAGIVAHVTLLEFDTKLRADEVLQKKLRSLPNVTIHVSARTTEVLGDGEKVTGLKYEDRTSSEIREVPLEGIFVQIGLLPNSEWLDGTVRLSNRKEIEIDARGATSVPGVFAAGDATTVPYKQIIIAMGAGATAALSAFDHLIRS
ncbi:MAG: alkyl hydroperoxide reductase subunit F [Phyllobacteriaceae bacterium]|nr:alkyl hydroperoxide reductase subunit F [Phyllobacteriaceae bacterium]